MKDQPAERPGGQHPGSVLDVRLRGTELLGNPLLNKGRAFTHEERRAFGLDGLLPSQVLTMEEQSLLELKRLACKGDDLERYIEFAGLQDRNETLFHRLLVDYPEELLPIAYTPTVGQACQEYSRTMRRPRGIWITPDDTRRIPELLKNSGRHEVRLVVATDNERILGLGDQGAGGMGIAIGKLALYSAAAGIHPSRTLPVSLDVGTDNPKLLDDPFYLGWRNPRLRGDAYLDVLDAFVEGLQEVFPHAVLQWEDLKQHTAIEVLGRYRDRLPSFNDDIQGTSAVALAAVLAALRVTGEPLSRQRVVLLGAGAAGTGIARLLRLAMRRAGMPSGDVRRAVVLLDSRGLLFEGRDSLHEDQRSFALQPEEMAAFEFSPATRHDLESVVRHVRPTVLVGTSGTPGTFTEAVIREMAEHCARPVVLPLSNPTSQAEATPAQVLAWSLGRALVATGSPFPAVEWEGKSRVVGQANNIFIFPGVGLGLVASKARQVSDEMFLTAAETLSGMVAPERLATGGLYPPLSELRRVSHAIAVEVVRVAACSALTDGDLDALVSREMWYPAYQAYRPT